MDPRGHYWVCRSHFPRPSSSAVKVRTPDPATSARFAGGHHSLASKLVRFVFGNITDLTSLRHDSAQDDESTNLMLDNLEPFHTLPATVKVVEHYIVADATPRKRSVAGKRRVEFQNILDMGLDRLF